MPASGPCGCPLWYFLVKYPYHNTRRAANTSPREVYRRSGAGEKNRGIEGGIALKRRLFAVLMTLALVCALPIWVVPVTSGDVTNALVSTAGRICRTILIRYAILPVNDHFTDEYPKLELAYQLGTSETEVYPGLFWMIWAAEEYEDKNAWEDEKVHCVTIDITDAAGTTHAVSISYRAEKVVSPEGEYTDSYPEEMGKLFIAIEPQAYKGLESGLPPDAGCRSAYVDHPVLCGRCDRGIYRQRRQQQPQDL